MSRAKMTLIGYYDYLDAVGVDLFADLSELPAGIDKDTLESNIILQGGEFEVLYGDPYLLKHAISPWVQKWYRTFEKWVTALNIDYDPLYNYDRTEEWTDTHTGTVTDAGSGTTSDSRSISRSGTNEVSTTDGSTTNNTRTDNLTETTNGTGSTETNGTHSGNHSDDTTTKVSAYDSADFANRDQVIGSGTDGSTDQTVTETESENTRRNTGTVTDAETRTGTSSTEGEHAESESLQGSGSSSSNNLRTNNLTDHHTARIFGNIGVTTSQQMLQSELELAKWNLYEHITDLFLQEFTIMVYE